MTAARSGLGELGPRINDWPRGARRYHSCRIHQSTQRQLRQHPLPQSPLSAALLPRKLRTQSLVQQPLRRALATWSFNYAHHYSLDALPFSGNPISFAT